MISLSNLEKSLLHSNREVKFRYDLLDFNENKIGELTSEKGSIAFNSLAQIKRTGKFTFRENEFKDVDWLNNKVQPYFMLKNGDTWIEWSLGIFLISSPSRSMRKSIYRDIEAYDSSLILVEDKFSTRYFIQSGTNYIKAIEDILNSAGIWKIKIPAIPGVISIDKEFEIGTSKIEAINDLLKEINYTSIWVDEMGYFVANPYILPNNRSTEYSYRNDELSIIIPETPMEEIDLFKVANTFIVVASNPEKEPLKSKYVNDNPMSLTSTVSRRRIITDFREENDILDQKTLDELTKRIAYEASQVYSKFIFSTALMPHHSYMDSLHCEHSELGISNNYIETNWEMDLRAGGRMAHSARRVITI